MGSTARRALIFGVAVIVAGCSASSSTAAPGTGSDSSGGGSGIVFSGQVNITGGVAIQGSFTDDSTASIGQSCTDYASTGMPFQAGWFGPNPAGASVGGQALSVSPDVPYKDFHGPGTYAGNYFIALKIGSSIYVTTSVTIVVNGDSSGSLTFADAVGWPRHLCRVGDHDLDLRERLS